MTKAPAASFRNGNLDGPSHGRLGLEELAAAWQIEGDLWLRAPHDVQYHLTIVDLVLNGLRGQNVP